MTTKKIDRPDGIYLEFKKIVINDKEQSGKDGPYYHAYLVKRDSKGNEQVLRGGLKEDKVTDILRDISTENKRLSKSKDAYSESSPKYERISRKLPIAEDRIDQIWGAAVQEQARIERARYDYDTLSPIFGGRDQNSNSTVAAIMKMAGLETGF